MNLEVRKIQDGQVGHILDLLQASDGDLGLFECQILERCKLGNMIHARVGDFPPE